MASKRSDRSAPWRARDRKVLWHPFTQHTAWDEEEFPVIERARGAWLIDVEGRRYLDGVSSMWCANLGHGNPHVSRAVATQLKRLEHATFLGLTHPPAVEYAEKLLAIAPRNLSRVFYSDNGSTAVEIALKMAVQFWAQSGRPSRNRFVALAGAYHGDTVGAMSVGGVDVFLDRYRSLLFPTVLSPAPYAYRWRGSPTLEACGRTCLERLDATLAAQADEVAGVILEPVVQGAGGMIVQPPGFVKGVERLCRRHDVLFILDEVMTGFGRTGTMFAGEQDDAQPDLMAVSKGMAGGYLPFAATLATERVFRAFLGAIDERKVLYHGHTYTGNPLGCAAGLGVLRAFAKQRILEHLPGRIEALRKGLAPLADHPHVGEIRQRGMVVGIELVKDRDTREEFPYAQRTGHRVAVECRKRGVILRPLADVVVVMPPLTSTVGEIRRLTQAVGHAVHQIFQGART